jgi:hypothetical protein
VRFERILERLCWLLREPLEPHLYGVAAPAFPKISNFRFHLFMHELVLDGREAYAAVLANPGLAAERLSQTREETLLYALGLLRYETCEFQIRVFRWGEFATSMKGRTAPGIFEFLDMLSAIEPRDEEWRPEAHKLDDGWWKVPGFEFDESPKASA